MIDQQKDRNVPPTWQRVKLKDITTKITDGAHHTPKYQSSGVPFISVKDINGNKIDFSRTKFISEEDHRELIKRCHPEEGDLVITKSGTIGRLAIVPDKQFSLFVSVALLKLDKAKLHSKFALYALQNHVNHLDIKNQIKGGLLKNYHLEDLRVAEIAVPEPSQQQTVVTKIEELLSELDKGIENLRLAQQQLKTYRQSVLKWAFEGKLTNVNEDLPGTGIEPNKVPRNGLEPLSMAAEEPAEYGSKLPKGWKWNLLGDHIESIVAGKSYRCQERPPQRDEVGIIKVSAVTWGTFDEEESKTCFTKETYNPNYKISHGDFLFSRANTLDLIGACVIVNGITKDLMLSDKILRFTFAKDILPAFVLHYLRSKQGRKQIETLSTGNQESMRNIGQEKIRQIKLPFCSIYEQKNIVEAIENRFSVADKLEESINQSLQQAEVLRQSVLKKAFEGKLVGGGC